MIKILYPEIEISKYMEEYDKMYIPNNLVPFDGVHEVIYQFKSDLITMCILSTKKIDRLKEHLNHLKIDKYFSYVH